MNADTLYSNKQFLSKILKSVPYIYRSNLSEDEIRSELNMAIVNCCRNFNPKRGNIFPYVRTAFFNGLKNLFRNKSFNEQAEVSLSAAYDLTYEEKDPEYIELITYLSSLPVDLLEDLTQFALGKKNKEQVVSNPSFIKLNVDRIIQKLDFIL